MKIGLFMEFSYPGKSEQQTYAEVLQQIASAAQRRIADAAVTAVW